MRFPGPLSGKADIEQTWP